MADAPLDELLASPQSVLLVGMGVANRAVAGALVRRGHSVVAIDDNPSDELREAAFDAQASQIAANVPIVELADQFRQSVPISVASGSLRPSVHAQLKGLKIYDWFAAIVCAEDTDRHKPEPDVFLMAAEKMKVPAGRCCVYEDGDLGIEAAHRAGMQVVDVRPILERWKTAFENTDPSNR